MTLISSKTLKKWLPPILVSNLKNIARSNIRLCGRYSNWQEALARCEGYDSDEILERTLTATQKVKKGQAVYQRDGELFEQIIYSWPVTSALMFAAKGNDMFVDSFCNSKTTGKGRSSCDSDKSVFVLSRKRFKDLRFSFKLPIPPDAWRIYLPSFPTSFEEKLNLFSPYFQLVSKLEPVIKRSTAFSPLLSRGSSI